MRAGTISLNAAAYEALGSPDAVELLFARKDRITGIRAADPNPPHTYPTRIQKGGTARVVSASSFFSHYSISLKASERHPAMLIGDLLQVDLTAPNSVERDNTPA